MTTQQPVSEQYPNPLGRRLTDAGLGTLAEERQKAEDRIEAEIRELDTLGYHEVAELVRDRTHHRAS